MSSTNIGIRLAVDGAQQAQTSLDGVGRALGQVGNAAMAAVAPLAGLLSAGAFAGKLVAVQREFDVLNSSLKTVAGGSAAAAKEMEWLKTFAKETPFGLAQATGGFVKMKALGLDPTRASLASFGNTAAAMGKDLNQMIEAVADASTGEFERLKEFGIKASKEGDKVKLTFQGVTTSIGNNAYEITQYLEGLGNNQFAGAMAERANTLDGAIASLGDTWDEMFRTISAGDVGIAITDSVRTAEAAVGDLTAIIKALDGATAGTTNQTNLLAGAQEALGTAFEAIAVLGVNVKYVLVQIGNELGGLAAQAVSVATGQFAQAAEIGRLMRTDAEAARKDVEATSERILAARAKAAQMATLGAANNYDEPATLRARAAGEKAIADAKAAAAKAVRDAEAAEAARLKAAEAAAKQAQKAAEAELEWRRKTTLDLVKMWDDQAEAAQKAYDAARMGALKLADATEAAQAATTAGLVDRLANMRDEIAAIGLTGTALAELNAVKAEQVIADKEIELIMLRNADASAVQIQLLEQEINLRKQLVTATRTKAAKEATFDAGKEADKAAKEAADAWQKAGEQMEKDITDALMRGFESGKGFAEVLRDTVANMFKTLVLRPVVSAIVSPVAGAITGSLGLSGVANAASTGLGLYNAGSTVAGWLGLGAATGTGIAAAAGTGLSLASAGTGLGLSASAGTGLGLAGTAASGASLGSGLAAGSAAASGSAMSSIMAAAPWLLGGVAVLSLLKSLDDSGTYHTGGLGSYSAAGGTAVGDAVKNQGLGFDLAAKDYTASGEQASAQIAAAVVGMLDSTAATFGQQAGHYVATAFARDTSGSAEWGAFLVKLGDKVLIDWQQGTDKWPGREFEDGEAGAKEYAAAIAVAVRDQLITQVPDWAAATLQALGDAPTLDQLGAVVTQINAAAAAMAGMGQASAAFAGLSETATAALIKALGGADASTASLGSYYTNFYSEAERAAIATAQLTDQLAALGVAMPTGRDAYKALVDAAVAAGDATLAAQLISLGSAFAQLVPAAADATTAAQAAAQAATTASTSALKTAIDREKQTWQTAVDAAAALRDEVQGVFATLSDGINALRADGLGVQGAAAQAQRYISQALAAAMGTGALPDGAALANAISTAQAGISGGQYGSETDRQYAALVLAGQLETLQGVAGDQLTEAERQYRAAQTQIEQLDKTLAYWEQQVDLSQGNIDATLSVADAITTLQEAIKPGSTKKAAADVKDAAVRQYAYSPTSGSGYTTDTYSMTATSEQIVGGLAAQAAGIRTAYEQAIIWTNGSQDRLLGSIDAVTAAAIAAGATATQAAAGATAAAAWADYVASTGNVPSSAADFNAYVSSLPKLAVGTNYIPQDGPYYLHAGESVQPVAYNPAVGGGMGNTARLESLVQGLTAEVQRLQAVVAEGNGHAQATAQTLAAVTNGNALVTEPVPNF